MKKLILLASLAFSINAFAQVPNYVPTNGLVGWWPFNNNANDLSGNAYNGTVTGAALTNDRFNNANGAYSFSSASNNTIAMTLANNISTNFTVLMWIKPNRTVNMQTESTVCPVGVSVPMANSNQNWALMPVQQNNPNLGVGGLSIGSNGIMSAEHGINILVDRHSYTSSLNNFTCVALVYRSDSTFLYVNGNVVRSKPIHCSGSNKTLSSNLQLGGTLYSPNFSGIIDDLGIWNRALTQQEITGLYSSCTSPTANITPQSTTTFCSGNSVVLNANTGSGYTYQWYNNASVINGATSSSYFATQSGSYTVKVIDGVCNTTSSATTVTVNVNPTVTFTPISNLISNNANSITLSGSPSGGTYSGSGVTGTSFNPQTSGLGSKTITYNYTSPQNCSGSANITTIVFDTTGIVCTSYDTIQVYDTTYVTVTDTTIITVNDTNFISVTDTLIINAILTGLIAPNNLNTIKVFPNPTNDHITINYGNFATMNGYTLKIINSLGQTVFTSPINQQSSYVDLSTWSGNGIYFVHIIDGQSNTIDIKKIVLQ